MSFFKLAMNGQSDKGFLLTSKVCLQGAICPCSTKSLKMCIKSDFEEIIMKLATNQTSERFFLNWQQIGRVIRNFCRHQNFLPKGLSIPALGLYTCIKSFKMCLKSYSKEIVLKLATNGQSNKGFLLTSTFVPKGLSAPALGSIHV